MKKLAFYAMAFFCCGFASAQSEEITFGVKAGFSNTTITGDDFGYEGESYEYDGKFGGYIGGLVDIPLAGNFHLQPELLISAEGADNASLTFVRIPVLAKYYFFQGFAVEAGPNFGILVAAEDNFDELTKSVDFGGTIGATYEFPFGLFADARFNAGFANISDVDGLTWHTASFMVGAGYRF